MNKDRVLELLEGVAGGHISPNDALAKLSHPVAEPLEFATIDHHRVLRQGFPEVVLGAGKTTQQVVQIVERIAAGGDGFLVTRATDDQCASLLQLYPEAIANTLGRTVRVASSQPPRRDTNAEVLVITAGTSDLPVAEEASETLLAYGLRVGRLTDVGVAGVHRILAHGERLRLAAAVIVIAGMDGALPSLVGGLVSTPVIAVPTSTGYGASFEGLAALLTMLNSCASGVVVVNIDNGFGAAVATARVLRA